MREGRKESEQKEMIVEPHGIGEASFTRGDRKKIHASHNIIMRRNTVFLFLISTFPANQSYRFIPLLLIFFFCLLSNECFLKKKLASGTLQKKRIHFSILSVGTIMLFLIYIYNIYSICVTLNIRWLST